jgi:molecular chaperone GrpE
MHMMYCACRSAGIEEVPSGPGTKFSPAVHEAIMQEVHTSVPEETILQVFQKGYQVGERLLRPSLVKVSTR